MSVNFKGDPLSDLQIKSYALRLRNFYGLGDLEIPDLEKILENKSILTRFGEKHFEYLIVPDIELGGAEAVTLISEKSVKILISRSNL